MKTLMAIFAHPDDEGVVSGTLAQHAIQGGESLLVCATRGEVGEISDPTLATAETLGEVRQQELERACEALGIRPPIFLGYRDSGMKDTPPNEDPAALIQADPQQVIGDIVALIRQHQPDVVITFEPFGWYGHPDHVAVSKWATEAFTAAGDPQQFPEAGEAWRPSRLFHTVIRFSRWESMVEEATAAGYLEPAENEFTIDVPPEEMMKTEAMITHEVDVRDVYEKKGKAFQAHQTQFSAEHMFQKIPPEMMAQTMGVEFFVQVEPPPNEKLRETPAAGLFD